MATKIKKTTDEEDEDFLREENERRTSEVRIKVVELREKSKERNDDDKRRRALESIHRMEWLKNKDDSSVLLRKIERMPAIGLLPHEKKELDDYYSGTAKTKPRGRKKERVEVIKNLEDLGLPIPDPPSSRFPPPAPPPPVNAWSVKTGAALFPTSTDSTIVPLRLKNYDEDYMLEKALKESLDFEEDGYLTSTEPYENLSSFTPNGNDRSPKDERSISSEERFGNTNRWVLASRNNIEHSVHGQRSDFEHVVHGQRNDFQYSDREQRNVFVAKPEMSYQNTNRSSRMIQGCLGPLRAEVTDSDKTLEKTFDTTSEKKSDGEKEPIDYYKKGNELAGKRRERAVMFVAKEAEKKKNEMVAQETQPIITSKTAITDETQLRRLVRFSPDVFTIEPVCDNNNEYVKSTSQILPDTSVDIMRSSSKPGCLIKTPMSSQNTVERQSPKIPEEQRLMWTSEGTQGSSSQDSQVTSSQEVPHPCDVPQPDSTTSVQSQTQEIPSACQAAAPQRMFTPEDFIIEEKNTSSDTSSMDQLSLGYGAALNQYAPYNGYPYDIGINAMLNTGVLSQYNTTNPALVPSKIGSPSPSYVSTNTAALTDNISYTMPNAGVLSQYNMTDPSVVASSTGPPSPSYVSTNTAALTNRNAEICYNAMGDGLQTDNIAPPYRLYNSSLPVSSPLLGDSNLSRDCGTPNTSPPGDNSANISAQNILSSAAFNNQSLSDSSTRDLNVNLPQVPVPSESPGVPSCTSSPIPRTAQEMQSGLMQNLFKIDPRLVQLNFVLNQYIMSRLSGNPMAGGDISFENLAALVPLLPNVPQTLPADVPAPSPPPPVLEQDLRMPYIVPQVPLSPLQYALLTTTDFQPCQYFSFSPPAPPPSPPSQATHVHAPPQQRLPGSITRGPFGRGRSVRSVQTLN